MGDEVVSFLDQAEEVVGKHYPGFGPVFEMDRTLYEECLRAAKPLATIYKAKHRGEFGMGLPSASTVADVIAIIQASWFVIKLVKGKLPSEQPRELVEKELAKTMSGDKLKQAVLISLEIATDKR